MPNDAVHSRSVLIEGRALTCFVPGAHSASITEQSLSQVLSVLCDRYVWYTPETSDFIRELGADFDWSIDAGFELRDWIPQFGLLPFKTAKRREDYDRYKAQALNMSLDVGGRVIPTMYEAGQVAAALAYEMPLVTADKVLAEFALQKMQAKTIYIPCA